MTLAEERRKILDLLDAGKIGAVDAIQMLAALGDAQDEPAELPGAPAVDTAPVRAAAEALSADVEDAPEESAAAPEAAPAPEPVAPTSGAPEAQGAGAPPAMNRWRDWWWLPMWSGVAITILAGVFMYLAYRGDGIGFWFACTFFPFSLGVAIMALAWASRKARWLHLRIEQKPGESPRRLAFSFPIPLRLTAWLVRIFKHRIPDLDNTDVDALVLALEKTSPDTPFFIEVDEGENGEHVQIYIG